MKDTINILLECDLRQAEVAVLVKILQEEPRLLVKLVKQAIVREVEEAVFLFYPDSPSPYPDPHLLLVDVDGLFWVATPNVFVLMNFFAIVARPLYISAIQPVLEELVRNQGSLEKGFPSVYASAILASISRSTSYAPSVVTEVCAFLYETIAKKFPGTTKAKAVEPLIIFRGFSNIIMKPQVYGLVAAERLRTNAKRAFIDISKSLTFLASGKVGDDVGIDEALTEFVNPQNIGTMEAFLTQLVDLKVEASAYTLRTSSSTLCLFTVLVRVDAAGMNRNHRVHSLITDLHSTVGRLGKMDVDINRASSEAIKDPQTEPKLTARRLSTFFLQPKINDAVLDLGKGALLDETAFKLVYKDTTFFFNIPKSKTSFKKLQSIVKKMFYTNELSIRSMDEDGDYTRINDNEDLTRCIERSGGLTVKLLLTNEITIIPKGNPDQSEMQKALMGIQEKDGDRRERGSGGGDRWRRDDARWGRGARGKEFILVFISFDQKEYIERRLRVQYPNEEFLRESFVISDPTKPDNPLMYVNDGFEKLTLYPSEEILGKNCRFLQGPLSDPNEIKRLSKAIKDGVDVKVELINYRKDGKPFWNRFHVFPLRDWSNIITNYVAVQQDITHIRQRARNPRDWTPVDVADWLKFMRVSDVVTSKFEENVIDGKQLLSLTPDKYTQLAVDAKESEKLNQYIAHIASTSTPVPSSKIPVKVYFEGDAHIVRVKPTVTLHALLKKVERTIKIRNLPVVALYENAAKEKVAFVHSKELTQLLLQARLRGESFKLWIDFFDIYHMQ